MGFKKVTKCQTRVCGPLPSHRIANTTIAIEKNSPGSGGPQGLLGGAVVGETEELERKARAMVGICVE